MKRKKKGQRRAERLTKKVGEYFVLLYPGPVPAGWEVVREFESGYLIRRVIDMKTGEVASG